MACLGKNGLNVNKWLEIFRREEIGSLGDLDYVLLDSDSDDWPFKDQIKAAERPKLDKIKSEGQYSR